MLWQRKGNVGFVMENMEDNGNGVYQCPDCGNIDWDDDILEGSNTTTENIFEEASGFAEKIVDISRECEQIRQMNPTEVSTVAGIEEKVVFQAYVSARYLLVSLLMECVKDFL